MRPGNLTVPAASKPRTLDLLPSTAAALQAVEPARLRSRSRVAGLDLAPLTHHASCSCGCAPWCSTTTWCLSPLQVGSLACVEQGRQSMASSPSPPPPPPNTQLTTTQPHSQKRKHHRRVRQSGTVSWDVVIVGCPQSFRESRVSWRLGPQIQSPSNGAMVPLHLGNLSFSAY